jgi:hypothetical protein
MKSEPYEGLGIEVVRNVLVEMDDGVKVALDLFVPLGGFTGRRPKLPCVLELIPYRKDSLRTPRADSWYASLPPRGYVVARADCRGTGGSDGSSTDEYTAREQRDGYQLVEWLASQDWCDGHVHMIGMSYGGFTSIQVAALAPPHLTSVVSIDFTDHRYTTECHHRGGSLRMWHDPCSYGSLMVAMNAMPPDPAVSGPRWATLWEEHIANSEPWFLNWIRHQTDDDYWRCGSVAHVADRIRCPVFMIGGWWDAYPDSVLRLADRLEAPWQVLIGPWDHATPDKGVPGPRIDWLPELVRWLDRWSRAADGTAQPALPVAVYMQRFDAPMADRSLKSGEWRGERSWPPPGQHDLTLYLGGGGTLDRSAGTDATMRSAYDPRVGVTRGLVSEGHPLGFPVDQSADDARSIVFMSDILEDDVHVLGVARASLHATASTSILIFVVAVSEVAADGTSALVTKGILNATRRRSFREPEPVVPGEVMDLEIDLQATGWIFSRGNRIRVTVSNADFPEVWPTPNAGWSELLVGTSHPSRIVLPVVDRYGSAAPPSYEPAPDVAPRSGGERTWEVTDDLLSGRRAVRIGWVWEPGVMRSFTDRLTCGGVCRVDPSSPASASVSGGCTIEASFGMLDVVSRSQITVLGSVDQFDVTIELEVTANGRPHSRRRWSESVPRVLL